MKFVSSKEKLLECINMVQKAVSARSILPILEGILIEVGDRVKLTGNNLEISIECYLVAEIYTKGSIVINSRIFGDIIRKMPDSDIQIEVREGDTIFIESENTHFKVKGLQSTGYPIPPSVDNKNEFFINQSVFRDMIRKTAFCVSPDSTNPVFTGILIEGRNRELSMVAADQAARMAYARSPEACSEEDFKVIIPARVLVEISRLLQTDSSPITICMDKNQVSFRFDGCRVIARLVDGEYFNYRSIMRTDYETKFTVNTAELLLSLERSLLIASREKKQPVEFNIKDDKLALSCRSEYGEISDELEIEAAGKDIRICFNPVYFIEPLRVIEDAEVEILLATDLGPATIRSLQGDKYAYIIAAVRA